MINEIKMIPIGDLEHHPENPRLDLGDLDELTASIRANGILQNLTVVPDIESCKYLVVIGNRRLEAAKAAGLAALPCSIRDMDHQEQIATMLQENMQRSDLTVYEQAKGIQMMMDLGFSRDEISERTGFSRSTIERRLAVATLPEKETKEAVECGWDLTDLVEISKIEDESTQKKLLIDTSPGQLKQAIEVARREQDRAYERKRLLPDIQKFATEMTHDQVVARYGNSWEHLQKYDVKLEAGAEVKVPEEEGKYFYNEAWGTIEIWRKVKKEKHIKTEQEIALEKKQHDAKELNDRMRERRIAFLNTFTPTKKLTAQLQENMWELVFGWKSTYNNGGFYTSYHSWSDVMFRQMAGMPMEEGRDKDESIFEEIERRGIPMGRAILCWMLCGGIKADDRRGYANEYNGDYQKDKDMDDVYEILIVAGYEMSEEEAQWKHGTHSFFQSDNPADDPEDDEEDEDDGEEVEDNN